jgi:cell division protein FtsW
MGERAVTNEFVKPAARRSSASKLPFDVPLLLIVASLLVIGLLMVYSTSLDASLRMGQEPTYLFTRQILWVLLGIGTAVGLSFLDYHFYKPFVLWALGVILVLLLIVLIRNDVRFNSSRALFEGSFQPSEFAKLRIILYLSFWLPPTGYDEKHFRGRALPCCPLLVSRRMIVLQRF